MIKLFIPILTSVSLLALSCGDVFACQFDNDKNGLQPAAVKKKQGPKVTASFEDNDHLNLKIVGKQNSKKKESQSSETEFCEYLKTNKLAHITSLYVEMETELTPKMVQHMLDYTPNLAKLCLNGFTKVDDPEINTLVRRFPNIVILDEAEDFVDCYPKSGEQSKPVAWKLLQPVLEGALRRSIANSAYVERAFCLDIHRDDFVSFHSWLDAFEDQFKYPIHTGLSGNGVEGDRINRLYEVYHEQINVHNYTKKEESAREVNEYKFFGGNLDLCLINERTFYNLMARVGFTEEDFKKGFTGIQGRIAVKPIQLKSKILAECKKELQEIIESILVKSPEAYVTFVFNLPIDAEYTLIDLLKFEGGIIKSHFREFNRLETIIEAHENRIYLCFQNDRRKMLDLHGFEKDGEFNGITKDGAFELVRGYIHEAYDDCRSECTILTGKGNHVNKSGTRGVLVAAFPRWMKHESIKPFVKKFVPVMGGGGFKVFLQNPHMCDLLPQVQQQPKPAQPQKKVNSAQPKAKQPNPKKQANVGPAKKPAQPAPAKQGPKPAKPQAQQNKGKGKQPGKPAEPQGNQQKGKASHAKQPQASKQASAGLKKGANKAPAKQNSKK